MTRLSCDSLIDYFLILIIVTLSPIESISSIERDHLQRKKVRDN